MQKKHEIIHAFIDSQNLNLGTGKDLFNKKRKRIYKGWQLDFKKFRIYLADKFRVSKAFLFIGYVRGNERMYRQLKSYGYKLVYKPTIKDNFGKAFDFIEKNFVQSN